MRLHHLLNLGCGILRSFLMIEGVQDFDIGILLRLFLHALDAFLEIRSILVPGQNRHHTLSAHLLG